MVSGATKVSPVLVVSVTRKTRVASVSCIRFHVSFQRGCSPISFTTSTPPGRKAQRRRVE